MIGVLALFGYALVLAVAGPRLLGRARWPQRWPRLGIAAWQALSCSLVGALLLGGVEMTMPRLCMRADLTRLPEDVGRALRYQFGTAGESATGTLGALLVLAVLVRIGHVWAKAATSAGRARARQREKLAVLGRFDPDLGATVVTHHVPAAYCLPGRGGRVVITTAALDALDDEQVRGVLAHERAHLEERHEVVLSAAAALARALPWIRALTSARQQITLLVEMAADDAASMHADRLSVADALLTLASSPSPVAAMAVSGTTSAARIRRLIDVEPAAPGHVLAHRAFASATVAIPLIMLGIAAAGVTRFNC